MGDLGAVGEVARRALVRMCVTCAMFEDHVLGQDVGEVIPVGQVRQSLS
jgi:hypothetical protein